MEEKARTDPTSPKSPAKSTRKIKGQDFYNLMLEGGLIKGQKSG